MTAVEIRRKTDAAGLPPRAPVTRHSLAVQALPGRVSMTPIELRRKTPTRSGATPRVSRAVLA